MLEKLPEKTPEFVSVVIFGLEHSASPFIYLAQKHISVQTTVTHDLLQREIWFVDVTLKNSYLSR